MTTGNQPHDANHGGGLSRLFLALRSYAFGSHRTLPSLDGLRALSIVLVLLGHLGGTRGFPFSFARLPLGIFGVRVFFVISGYLITSILLKELAKTSGISLPRFYLRRGLRLFPASYFLIAAVSVMVSRRWVTLEHWDLRFALFYGMNFYDARGWPLGHLWSLAVEEQFYLIWPLTLRALGPARATRLLFGILFLAPWFRLASPLAGPAFNFIVWADALGTGCLLALLREDLYANQLYQSILRSKWFFAVPLLTAAASVVPSTKLQWLFCETIMNTGIALSIDWAMRNPGGRVGRILNWPAVSFLGAWSYSLYLWQQPFLNRNSDALFCSFPVNLLLAFLAALASFLLIEAPFLRIRPTVERWLLDRRRAPVAQPS